MYKLQSVGTSRRTFSGGLFPEDRRRTRPVVSELKGEQLAENGRGGLRSLIFQFLNRSCIQCAITDSNIVPTMKGKRRLVYPAGWPDITASIPVTGRAWAIEVKTDDGDLRDSQEDKLQELQAAGWLITVARGVDDVSAELKRQLALIDRKLLDDYFVKLRHLRSEAAQREVERELQDRERKARKVK